VSVAELNSLVDAVAQVLRDQERPLSAKALAAEIQAHKLVDLTGLTPWKTVGARLAVDIKSNARSPFMRVGRGMYALREWTDLTGVSVPARKINALDEDILAIPSEVFDRMRHGRQVGELYGIPYRELLEKSIVVHRKNAERSEDLVQLIPSFLIFHGDEILSFKRTRKTPEQRLHDSYSIVFGGHLQAEDNPSLLSFDDRHAELFLFRELREELGFNPPYTNSEYLGVLHLRASSFERQHAGVVFMIDLSIGTKVQSLEPGYHSGLQFIKWDKISESPVMEDRWSQACISHIRGRS
jgi:predicted NUDIX family phosphoesterase